MPEVEIVHVKILILPLCVWLMAGLCGASARAQAATTPVRSVTRQFTARKLPSAAGWAAPARPAQTLTSARGGIYLLSSRGTPALGNNDEVALEPATLVVSCERLKTLLLDKLGLADRWQGRVDLTINPELAEDTAPQLKAIHDSRGWYYQLELPRRAQEEILLRSLIHTLLLEMANRQAGGQSSEIPLWLVEGLGADLQANSFPTFIVQPGQNWTSDIRWNKTKDKLPTELRQRAPLTFQQLSWPEDSDLTADGLPLYRSCAQLFVEDLLRLNDGQACLRSMIGQLPEHWNWQTAFLLAFHSHFDQFLDVEKWWSLSYIDFVNGYKARTWSAEDGRKNLQSSLDVPVEVHFGPDQMPVEARVTLQEVIRQWHPLEAYNALQRAINELSFLLPRATPELRPLAQLYLKTLLDYLRDSQAAAQPQQLGKNAPSLLGFVKRDAIKRLDELDRLREAHWPGAVSTNLPQLSVAGTPQAKSTNGR
jgi:hypothetical protein